MRKYPVNTWNQIRKGDVAVSYRRAESRSVFPSGTVVWGKGFMVNPDAKDWWNKQGNKEFSGQRAKSLPQALAWASEKFGIKKWRRNGMGDYVNAEAGYLPLQCEVERAARRARKGTV